MPDCAAAWRGPGRHRPDGSANATCRRANRAGHAAHPPNATYAAKAATFQGAPATKSHYRAVYQLDSDDPKLINQTLHNMKNALDDPRLKGRLALELVVFGRGTTVFKKDQPFEADVLALQQAGVVLSARRLQRRARQLPGQSMRPQGHCQPQLCCGDYEGE